MLRNKSTRWRVVFLNLFDVIKNRLPTLTLNVIKVSLRPLAFLINRRLGLFIKILLNTCKARFRLSKLLLRLRTKLGRNNILFQNTTRRSKFLLNVLSRLAKNPFHLSASLVRNKRHQPGNRQVLQPGNSSHTFGTTRNSSWRTNTQLGPQTLGHT